MVRKSYVSIKDLIVIYFELSSHPVFAWEAYERGTDIHLQADPTKLELLHKEFERRKGDFKQSAKDSILEKYGGQEHLNVPPKQLLLAQTVGVGNRLSLVDLKDTIFLSICLIIFLFQFSKVVFYNTRVAILKFDTLSEIILI